MRNTLKIGLVLFVVMGLMPLAAAHTCTRWSVGVDIGHTSATTCVNDPELGTVCVGRPHVCKTQITIYPHVDELAWLLA